MHIVILEDEHLAGEKLVNLIKHKDTNATIKWMKAIESARVYLSKHKVDLLFSDIELLDGNVFELFKSYTPQCPIIFCTAYDKYLMEAFSSNGIAYITKPYDTNQFNQAWEKYRNLFINYKKAQFENLIDLKRDRRSDHKQQFVVKKTKGIIMVLVKDIMFFRVSGDYTIAYTQDGKSHLLNMSLKEIGNAVDPDLFVQINRAELINIDFVIQFSPHIKNRLSIRLKDLKEPLLTSNRRSSEFRQMFKKRNP